MTWRVIEGDCVEVMVGMAESSVDAVVTDPPAGIAFMNKHWDAYAGRVGFVRFLTGVMRECLRLLKPGGHALVWALPRTSHWTGWAIEEAGFEVRDVLVHLFGSGFPKSLNLDGEWKGWGTALKPGAEHWILARKPLVGSVAQNVLAHGTGALNIDGTRIGTDEITVNGYRNVPGLHGDHGYLAVHEREPTTHAGRWPANVILDEDAAALLDEQSGERPTPSSYRRGEGHERRVGRGYGGGSGVPRMDTVNGYGDTGGASRFFYVPKADSEERNRGLEHLASAFSPTMGDGIGGREHSPEDARAYRANTHPTVKPVELMQWLCRLVTPPHGTILDPFTGSGSTGIAALREGFSFMGVEREPEYVQIARDRIIGDAPLFNVESEEPGERLRGTV